MKNENPKAKIIHDRINARLADLNLSANDTSVAVGHKDAIRNIKRGSVPSSIRLAQIAKKLECSVPYLLGETDDPSPDAAAGSLNAGLLVVILRKALIQQGFASDIAESIAQAVARYYPIFEPLASSWTDPRQIEISVDRFLKELAPGLQPPQQKK